MKEQVTMPSNKLVPKGRASIELFDLDGELVQKEVQDNYVNQTVLQDISDLMTLNSLGITVQRPPLLQLNSGLILTDFDGEVTPQNRHSVKGNTIGFGYMDGVYSSKKTGGYNATESVISSNYIKLVYDFPTSSANGTFNSIYTGPYRYNSNEDIWINNVVLSSERDISYTYTAYRMFRSGGKLMYLNGTKFEVFDSLPISNTLSISGMNKTLASAPKTVYTLPESYKRVAFNSASQKYYFTKETRFLYSSPVNDPTNITLEKDLTTVLTAGGSFNYTHGMAVDNAGKYLYIQHAFDGLYKIDIATWTLLEKVGSDYSTGGNPSFDIEDPEIYYRSISANTGYIRDLSDNKILSSYVSLSGNPDNTWVQLSKNLFLCYRYYNYMYDEITLSPMMFSRALLEQPVTKTSQNTMKITYEFMLPEYDLLSR